MATTRATGDRRERDRRRKASAVGPRGATAEALVAVADAGVTLRAQGRGAQNDVRGPPFEVPQRGKEKRPPPRHDNAYSETRRRHLFRWHREQRWQQWTQAQPW